MGKDIQEARKELISIVVFGIFRTHGELDLTGKASVLKTDGLAPLGVRVSRSPQKIEHGKTRMERILTDGGKFDIF